MLRLVVGSVYQHRLMAIQSREGRPAGTRESANRRKGTCPYGQRGGIVAREPPCDVGVEHT